MITHTHIPTSRRAFTTLAITLHVHAHVCGILLPKFTPHVVSTKISDGTFDFSGSEGIYKRT